MKQVLVQYTTINGKVDKFTHEDDNIFLCLNRMQTFGQEEIPGLHADWFQAETAFMQHINRLLSVGYTTIFSFEPIFSIEIKWVWEAKTSAENEVFKSPLSPIDKPEFDAFGFERI